MSSQATSFMALYMLGVIANMCASFQAPLVGRLSNVIGVSPNQIGLAMSAQFVTYLFGGSAVGHIVARVGVRRAAQCGLALVVLTLLWNWRAHTLVALVLGNIVQGAGMLLVAVSAQIGVTVVSSDDQRARLLANWATAPLVGLALGLLLSSVFADRVAWRAAFPAMAAIAALLSGLSLLLPHTPLVAASGQPAAQGLARETRAARVCLAVTFSVIAINGSVSSWPLYLSRVHGMAAGTIAAISSVAMLAGIAGSLVIGAALGRHWSAGRLIWAIVPLALLSAVVVFGALGGFPATVIAMFTWNLATGAMTALFFAILPRVMREPRNLPAATGMLYQFAAVGTILGAPLYLWLADGVIASLNLALVTCGTVLAAGLVFPSRDGTTEGAEPTAA